LWKGSQPDFRADKGAASAKLVECCRLDATFRSLGVVTEMPNLLNELPNVRDAEHSHVIVAADGLRLERIVSFGQASPEGFWYDQDDAEGVIVLSGKARLAMAGETQQRELGPGDAIFIPAHCRHRVAWTTPDQPTVWLALFIDPRLSPTG